MQRKQIYVIQTFVALTTYFGSRVAEEVDGAWSHNYLHSDCMPKRSHSDAHKFMEKSTDHFSSSSSFPRCIFTKLFLINHHFSVLLINPLVFFFFFILFGIKTSMKFMKSASAFLAFQIISRKLIMNLWSDGLMGRNCFAMSAICDMIDFHVLLCCWSYKMI